MNTDYSSGIEIKFSDSSAKCIHKNERKHSR
jgi:hypothetical protein